MPTKSLHALTTPAPLPSAFSEHREYLREVYLHRKRELRPYSYARFAADLHLGAASNVHHIISGKRKLTVKAAAKIAQNLGLNGLEKRYFLKVVALSNATSPAEREAMQGEVLDIRMRIAPTPLAKDQLAFVGEWFHPVVRELVALARTKVDARWVAQVTLPAIKAEQARQSLELLTRLGLVSFDVQTGQYAALEGNLFVPDGADEGLLFQYQQKMLDLARDAILGVDTEKRHVTTASLRVRRGDIAAVKKKIEEFNSELLTYEASACDADEVYQLNIQWFPLTQVSGETEVLDEPA